MTNPTTPTSPSNPVDQQRSSDEAEKNKTIYSSSYSEIFRKNFVAGFSRAIGGIFIYIIFMTIVVFFAYRFLLPQFQGYINDLFLQLTPALEVSADPGKELNPQQIQDLINQLTVPSR